MRAAAVDGKPFRPKLIAVDIDGTLIDNEGYGDKETLRPTPRTLAAGPVTHSSSFEAYRAMAQHSHLQMRLFVFLCRILQCGRHRRPGW